MQDEHEKHAVEGVPITEFQDAQAGLQVEEVECERAEATDPTPRREGSFDDEIEREGIAACL